MENVESGAWVAAVVAPWAMAPHPNFSQEAVSGPSLLALVAQLRLTDLELHKDRLEGQPSWILDLLSAAQRSIALGTVRSGADDLWNLAETESLAPNARIGAALFAAVAEVELDELGVAVERLKGIAETVHAPSLSKSSSLALAVLHQQIAARQFELFDYVEAMETLLTVDSFLKAEGPWDKFQVSLGISWSSSQLQDDIQRSVAAHSAQLRARIEGFGGNTWVDVVKARSNWPDHRAALGGASADRKFVELTFEQWVGSRSKRRTWTNSDPVISPTLESLLASELSGNVNAYMRGREALAQHRILQIVRDPMVEADWPVQDAIRLLRRARSKDSLKRIMEWIYLQGPEAALSADAEMILQRRDFPSDASALDFLVLSWAAQYMSFEMLTRSFEGALRYIRSPRGAPGGRIEDERIVWSAMVKLFPGSGKDHEMAQIAFDAAKSASSLELIEKDLLRLMDLIDWSLVDRELLSAWRSWGTNNVEQPTFRDIARKACRLEGAVTDEAMVEDLTGSDLVLHFVNNKANIPFVSLEALDRADSTCIEQLAESRKSASKGAYSFGGVDIGEMSAVYAKVHNRPAVWSSLAKFLVDRSVPQEFKARPLSRIAEYGMEAIPKEARSRLASGWQDVIASRQVGMFSDPASNSKFTDALRAAAVLGILSRDEALASATELAASGSPDERVAACEILSDVAAAHGSWQWAQLLLLHLSRDSDATVRSEASKQLAFVGTVTTSIKSLVDSALLKSLRSGGIRTPLLTLHGLQKLSKRQGWREYGDEVESVVEAMAEGHPARIVREAASDLIAGGV